MGGAAEQALPVSHTVNVDSLNLRQQQILHVIRSALEQMRFTNLPVTEISAEQDMTLWVQARNEVLNGSLDSRNKRHVYWDAARLVGYDTTQFAGDSLVDKEMSVRRAGSDPQRKPPVADIAATQRL